MSEAACLFVGDEVRLEEEGRKGANKIPSMSEPLRKDGNTVIER